MVTGNERGWNGMVGDFVAALSLLMAAEDSDC